MNDNAEVFQPELLITTNRIRQKVEEIGHQITNDYDGKNLVLICVLKTGFIFCSDLMKQINLPLQVDFISFVNEESNVDSLSNIKMDLDVSLNLEGRDVIIVDAIISSGLTLKYLQTLISLKGPKSLKTAVLFYKSDEIKYDVNTDYFGFEIEADKVVGYGLGHQGRFKELPYLGTLSANH
jgi:hypoxanthine phosphoribosyltransferase